MISVQIKLKSFHKKPLHSFIKQLKLKNLINFKIKGPISLPTKTKLFTVLKSPHVHKKAREQFFLSTHKRLIILDCDSISIGALKELKALIQFLYINTGEIQFSIKFDKQYAWKDLNFQPLDS